MSPASCNHCLIKHSSLAPASTFQCLEIGDWIIFCWLIMWMRLGVGWCRHRRWFSAIYLECKDFSMEVAATSVGCIANPTLANGVGSCWKWERFAHHKAPWMYPDYKHIFACLMCYSNERISVLEGVRQCARTKTIFAQPSKRSTANCSRSARNSMQTNAALNCSQLLRSAALQEQCDATRRATNNDPNDMRYVRVFHDAQL